MVTKKITNDQRMEPELLHLNIFPLIQNKQVPQLLYTYAVRLLNYQPKR